MAINQYFNEQTEQAILQRMLDGMRSDIDKRQGSIAYDLTAPAAIELAEAYINLDRTLSYAFLNEDMPSELLTAAAVMYGISRKQAIKATGSVVFSGSSGQVIPAGTQIRTDDGIYFYTLTQSTIISDSISVQVEAVIGGISGNVDISEINTVVGDLAGVLLVNNAFEFTDGVDEESDESLLQRIYDRVRKPATSGNIYHYEQWAKEVSGVGDAKVYPTWDGPGTVKVVLLSDTKKSPDLSVITETENHITSVRPVGATVTVVGASEVPINIDANLTLASEADISEVKEQIETAVASYLESLAFKDSLIRYTRIAAILLDIPRIVDYTDLKVNGGMANIEVLDEQVAVLGTVTLHEL